MHPPAVIGDLPFMSYQVSDEDAVRNGGRFIERGRRRRRQARRRRPVADGRRRAIARRDPGHGPHRPHAPDRHVPRAATRPRGASRSTPGALRLRASRSQAAGCFAIVLECVPEPVAAAITRRADDPDDRDRRRRRHCDGQVLVLHGPARHPPDADFLPKFVKQFAHVGAAMREGVTRPGGGDGQDRDWRMRAPGRGTCAPEPRWRRP